MTSITRFTGAILTLLLLSQAASAVAQTETQRVDVTRATLANGMQVVVLRDTLAPVVAVWTNYLAGSSEESITGTAHAQEHMMFRGSKTLTASQFSETTAITGGNFNADTQSEITQYFFEMPAQYLDLALHLERSRASGVLDDQKLWNQERGAITQEVTSDNSSAIFRLIDRASARIFAGTPYANFGLGTVASFKQIQAPELKRFYDRWYHPNNAIMVIAGDVDPQATIAKVTTLFGDLKPATLPARAAGTPAPLSAATLNDNSSDPFSFVFLAYRVPGYNDQDYFASEILNDVLNSQRGALYGLQADGKALQTFAFSTTHPELGASLVGSIIPVTTKPETAVADLENVIDGYKKTGLPAELVEVAKQREVAQAQFARNSINGLATTWSNALAIEHRTPDDDLAGLQRVTVDDVNRVLRASYDNATATIGVSTPKESAGSAFGERAGEDNTFVPTEHTGLPAFARHVLAQLHVPATTVRPAEQTLGNGLKLVVVPSKISQTVIVRGQIANNPGLQTAAGKDGVDDILGGLFGYGTTTYDRLAYQAELDRISASESAGSSFSLDVLTANFDRGMQLLADNQLHPALPEAAFTIVKQQTVGALSGNAKSPDVKAQRALAAALYPAGDPARRYATPESAAAVTYDDVKHTFATDYRPDLTTIVIVGDVTPEHARSVVDAAFGSWTAVGPKPNVFPPAVPLNRPSRVAIPAIGRVQSDVTLAETLPISNRDPDFPVLGLANTVLTGGFYASLLFHDLRELHGYAYNVNSGLSGGRNRSSFEINYGSDPANVDRAAKLVVTDLAALQKKPLGIDRLTRAKALILGALPVREESYDGLSSELMTYASTDRPLDQARRDAAAQLRATPERVRAAMAKWIRPTGFARVVLIPGK